jgi:hypothetical protein
VTPEDRCMISDLLARAGVAPRTVAACWNDATLHLAADVACQVVAGARDARWFEDYMAAGGSRAAALARMNDGAARVREPGADPLVTAYPDAPPGDRLLMHWVDQTLTVAAKFASPIRSMPPDGVARYVVEHADALKAGVRGNRPGHAPVTRDDRRLMVAAALRLALEWADPPAVPAADAEGGGQ